MKFAIALAQQFSQNGCLLTITESSYGGKLCRLHNALSKSVFRKHFNRQPQIRCLFSEDFLGISSLRQKQLLYEKELTDQGTDIHKLRHSIEERLQSIKTVSNEDCTANESSLVFSSNNQMPQNERLLLSNDISNLILTTRTKDHMKVTQHALNHFVKTKQPFRDSAVLLKKSQLFKDFMLMCRLHKWNDTANSTWNDGHFMELAGYTEQGSNRLAMNMPTVTLCYLDILYEKKLYQAVIDEILKLEKVVQLPVFVYVLGMMACLKMNTEESLNVATGFYNGSNNKQIMKISRVVHPYSLLLHKQGNTSLALETVSLLPTKHFPYLRAGIMVHFLSHLNRPDEACSLLEVMLRNYDRQDKPLAMARGQGVPRLIFSMETVKSLTGVIRTHKDASLNARLGGVFSRLDKIASITDQSIDTLVTAEIDISSFEKARKLKYLKKWERRIDDADAEIEDIDQLEDSQHR